MPVILPRLLCLTADRKRVVEEGDLESRFVLGGPGAVISDEDAAACGLVEYLKGPEPVEETPPANEQKAAQPEENKMLKRTPRNKGK